MLTFSATEEERAIDVEYELVDPSDDVLLNWAELSLTDDLCQILWRTRDILPSLFSLT